MPRKDEPLDEDFLDVDKSIPGQNYVCVSFVSPERVLNKKELFYYHNFSQFRLEEYKKQFKTMLETIIDEADDNTVNISKVVKLKKSMDKLFSDDVVDFEKFKSNMEDYKFRELKRLNTEFDKENDFQTSVRGVKIRGSYDSYREAEVRAKVLQRTDPTFDVFVGQVGYWLPWDPDAHNVDKQEYQNEQLNKLVKEYKDNEVKKDIFYQEQTRQRKKEANNVTQRLKKKLEAKKRLEAAEVEKNKKADTAESVPANPKHEMNDEALEEVLKQNIDNLGDSSETNVDVVQGEEEETVKFEVGDSTSKPVSFEETTDSLQAEDPWMKRKMEGNK
jgi:hypothetical protein